MDCRQLEVRQAKLSLEKNRVTWIISEHEMGGDDFLAVLRQTDGADDGFFRLDLSSFDGLDETHELQTTLAGGDINQLCESLLDAGKSYLLLDNAKLGQNEARTKQLAEDIRELAQTFLDYCPELKIIIRSGHFYEAHGVKPIILRALDEPECKLYIELHPYHHHVKSVDVDSGDIYSYTTGRPERIDKLLKKLRFSSFEELAHGSSDQSIDERASLPEDLLKSIEQIQNEDNYSSRVYYLLTALSLFRFGENVHTLRYFGNNKRLRPEMAEHLVELGLAEPVDTHELLTKPGDHDKFITIKPAILHYTHKILGEELLTQHYEDAASVYFGKDWKIGKCKLNSSFRLSDQRIYSIMEQNASLILTRIISDALEANDAEDKIKPLMDRVRVLHHYILRLAREDKHLSILRLCRVILPKLEKHKEHNLVKDIHLQYARCLRMLGEHEEALTQFEELLKQKNPSNIVASIHINMAYAYKGMSNHPLARQHAKIVRTMKLKGDPEYHAQSILLGLSDAAHKYQKLENLAVKARRDNCAISSNNMMMDVIAELNNPPKQIDEYKKLIERARGDHDLYNMMRASIHLAQLAIENDIALTQKDLDNLLAAYKYACSQRQRSMFKQSHAALWTILEGEHQLEALMQLFRHSSTLQRVTGNADLELSYLKRLVEYIRETDSLRTMMIKDSPIFRYFSARALSHNLMSTKQLAII